VKWFDQRLNDPNTRLYILEHQSTPVATVRFQRTGAGHAMTHIVVAPQFRGLGVAQSALQTTVPMALRELQLTTVHAVIKKNNLASIAAFQKSGFVFESESEVGELVTMMCSGQ